MENEQKVEDLGLSTYSLITTKRLLDRYSIELSDEELEYTLKAPKTFYHRLLRIPLKNILNGIILQQAKDYQIYLQKVFIDYLLALDANKEEGEEEGNISGTQESLEDLRLELVGYNETFTELEQEQTRLIGFSQAALLKHAMDWKNKVSMASRSISGKFSQHLSETIILKVLNQLLIYLPLEGKSIFNEDPIWIDIEKQIAIALNQEDRQIYLNALPNLIQFALESEMDLNPFWDKSSEMSARLRESRTYFQNMILKANECLLQLAEYKQVEEKNKKNREDLYFDPSIGD